MTRKAASNYYNTVIILFDTLVFATLGAHCLIQHSTHDANGHKPHKTFTFQIITINDVDSWSRKSETYRIMPPAHGSPYKCLKTTCEKKTNHDINNTCRMRRKDVAGIEWTVPLLMGVGGLNL